MKRLILVLLFLPTAGLADDAVRQVLVTFKNDNARYEAAGFQAPYRARKRYALSPHIRKDARAIAREHSMVELEQWPLKSLAVYCFVFEVAGADAATVVAALAKDPRVESAQFLQEFKTQAEERVPYDDTYVAMQHGLDTIELAAAHRFSRGEGVRIAVVDSDADDSHEDLRGSMKRSKHVDLTDQERDRHHGTAVASVIAARANNALGMVGVAPAATLEVAEACWRGSESGQAVCDSFSLAKALDAMFDAPPDVINMSLSGPEDPLLRRILARLIERGATVVAASPNTGSSLAGFPASMREVIPVASMGEPDDLTDEKPVFAPGERILVAVPRNEYEFQSGSSLAAAHVSGIVALLKANSSDLDSDEIRDYLYESQIGRDAEERVVNACRALQLARTEVTCD